MFRGCSVGCRMFQTFLFATKGNISRSSKNLELATASLQLAFLLHPLLLPSWWGLLIVVWSMWVCDSWYDSTSSVLLKHVLVFYQDTSGIWLGQLQGCFLSWYTAGGWSFPLKGLHNPLLVSHFFQWQYLNMDVDQNFIWLVSSNPGFNSAYDTTGEQYGGYRKVLTLL